jgi:hypothetical protein
MKQPTFPEGVAVALAASLAGGAAFNALDLIFPGTSPLRLLIAGISLVYVIYLLGRSPERVGRVMTIAAWLTVAGVLWFTQPPLPLYLCLHLGAIWLIRSLYFYSSMLSALADLGLNSLALSAAIWAITRTNSVFLGLWCFLLVQALFIVIPKQAFRRSAANRAGQADTDRFLHAYRNAEAAVRKLSSVH